MISKFQSILKEPQDVCVKQLDDSRNMYLIAKGACMVNVMDEKKNIQRISTLRPGDYFGEISLIYGCKRTATVVSTKYSTLAMLSYQHYKEILIEFPDLEKELKQQVYRYNDRMKRFMMKAMQRIEYF